MVRYYFFATHRGRDSYPDHTELMAALNSLISAGGYYPLPARMVADMLTEYRVDRFSEFIADFDKHSFLMSELEDPNHPYPDQTSVDDEIIYFDYEEGVGWRMLYGPIKELYQIEGVELSAFYPWFYQGGHFVG